MGQKKSVKLGDIADQLGVSIVTVSNALNGRKGVSDELRKKVREKADELGYQLSIRTAPKEKTSYIIGVAVAERYVKEFPSFYMDIYQQVAKEAVKKGHLTVLDVISPQRERVDDAFDSFTEQNIAGLILIGELHDNYIRAVRRTYDIPVVCVDYYDVYSGMDYIVTDGFHGMEQMTEYLIQRGYHDLAFVGSPKSTKNIMDRYLGYCKALERAGIKESQQYVIPDRELELGSYHIDMELPKELPEGFVCNCDKTAGILIEKLRGFGVHVPEDVAVVGFDHYYPQGKKGIEITTYENNQKVLAQISVNTLIKRIEGKDTARGVRFVKGDIVIGNTVKEKEERHG